MSKQSTKSDFTPDINFLFEMGAIRLMHRMWTRQLSPEFANLAEHHFRMFWIAMVIAAHEGDVDTGKLAKMVLVHDISESRTGDVDYLARQYVTRNEKLGIQDMLQGTSLNEEFQRLWDEYEERTSIEARIAKDADNLDIDFELAEQAVRGNQLWDLYRPGRDHVAKEKLFTKTAKLIYDQLQTAKPHDWHMHGRNRFVDGDWKK